MLSHTVLMCLENTVCDALFSSRVSNTPPKQLDLSPATDAVPNARTVYFPGMANLEAALSYLRVHGDQHTLVRLGALLGVKPSALELEGFTAGQLLGGGWAAHWSGGQASLMATCERLSLLESVGALRSLEAVRAVGYIAASQAEDGTWTEPSPLARRLAQRLARSSPELMRPDDPDSRPWLTAHCAFWLEITQSHRERVEAAVEYLRALQNPVLRVRWLTAGLLSRLGLGLEANAVLVAARDQLGFTTPASELARMLIGLRLAGVAVTHPTMTRARSLLGAAQVMDGSWAANDPNSRNLDSSIANSGNTNSRNANGVFSHEVSHETPNQVPGELPELIVTLEAFRALRLTEPAVPRVNTTDSTLSTPLQQVRPNLAAVVIGLPNLVSGLGFWRGLLAREPVQRGADEVVFDLDGVRITLNQDSEARPGTSVRVMLSVPPDAFDALLERARTLGAQTVRSRFEAGRLRGVVFQDPQGVRFELCQTTVSPQNPQPTDP